MANGNIKLTIDMSELNRVVQVHCRTFDCKHNSNNNSYEKVMIMDGCNLKKLCIVGGKCRSYEKKANG